MNTGDPGASEISVRGVDDLETCDSVDAADDITGGGLCGLGAENIF